MAQEYATEDITIVAKAHNTLPEFMFVTSLSTTACLMGPDDEYSGMGPPGCGKSQAFRLFLIHLVVVVRLC